MKKISLLILAVTLTIASCKNYDDDFKDLNASIAALQTQVAGFSSLQAGLTALQSSVASLQTAVNAIPTTAADLSGLQADLTTSLADIAALQASLNTVVANYSTSTDLAAAQADIDALTAALVTAQAGIDELLAGNNVYTGDLNITNAAELAFAQSLSADLSIISGNVKIDNTNISPAAVSAIVANIISVTGYVDVKSIASVDLSALVSVGTTYKVVGVDIADDALANVGGIVTLNYDGNYTQPNLASSGAITLTDWATTTGSGAQAGTLAVDFSGLTSGTIQTGLTPGTVIFTEATSVKLNVIAPATTLTSVTAAKADTVDMMAANYKNGLTVVAGKAGSAITITGNMFSGTTMGALSVTGNATSTLNAAAVTKAGAITVTTVATAVSFPALTVAGAVAANAAVSFNAPAMVATSLSATAAKTVNIGSATLAAGIVENLTFTALATTYTSDTTLKTANVTGKVGSTNGFTTTSAVLTSAEFAGELDAVSVTGGTLLTSLSTAGNIDSFTLENSPIITLITLGHAHIAGGNGSVLVINNNATLASLKTSANYLRTLTVTNNALLASMDFASYVSVPSAGAIGVTITNNKLSGNYVNASYSTITGYDETEITSADLTTLKPFVVAYDASTTTTASLTFSVDLKDVFVGTSTTAVTLTAAQTGDTVYTGVNSPHTTGWNAIGTLADDTANNVDEFLLIN